MSQLAQMCRGVVSILGKDICQESSCNLSSPFADQQNTRKNSRILGFNHTRQLTSLVRKWKLGSLGEKHVPLPTAHVTLSCLGLIVALQDIGAQILGNCTASSDSFFLVSLDCHSGPTPFLPDSQVT